MNETPGVVRASDGSSSSGALKLLHDLIREEGGPQADA